MRRDDEHRSGAPHLFPETFHDAIRIGRVEVSGGLIRQHQRRRVRERPRDGDALLFAAGKRVREAATQAAHAEGLQAFERLRRASSQFVESPREQHVFLDRQRRQEIEKLKDEPHVLTSIAHALGLGELVHAQRHSLPVRADVQTDRSYVRYPQSADQVQQGRLAAAARAAYGDDLASFGGKADIAQNPTLRAAVLKAYAHPFDRQNGRGPMPPRLSQPLGHTISLREVHEMARRQGPSDRTFKFVVRLPMSLHAPVVHWVRPDGLVFL